MEPSKNYQPISCVFYDLIEHHATRKEIVKIKVATDSGELVYESKILDTLTKDKVEYILLDQPSIQIRMDQIISLNGEKLADFGPNC